MKVLVGIKRTIDANVKVRVKADESGVETANVKMTLNPFCEIAVEEAVRMKEAGSAEEILVVTAGPEEARQTLMTALAIGADRAVHVIADQDIQPLAVAKVLKAYKKKQIVFMREVCFIARPADYAAISQLVVGRPWIG